MILTLLLFLSSEDLFHFLFPSYTLTVSYKLLWAERYFLNLIFFRNNWSYLKPLYTFGKQYCPSPTLRVSQLIYKITILWKFRLNRTSESGENNGNTHSCFHTFRRVMTCVYNKSVILVNENLYCFTVFSKSKAFHARTNISREVFHHYLL